MRFIGNGKQWWAIPITRRTDAEITQFDECPKPTRGGSVHN